MIEIVNIPKNSKRDLSKYTKVSFKEMVKINVIIEELLAEVDLLEPASLALLEKECCSS